MSDTTSQRRASGLNRQRPVVAIDGPSGAGKSTVGKRLAARLGFAYIDTGAIYRAVSLLGHRQGVDLGDEAGLAALVPGLPIRFVFSGGENRIFLNGVDETAEIRSEKVGLWASRVSAHPQVRAGLLGLQRSLGADGGVVMDGRDIGTVVFPDAELKFFMVADPDARALRRYKELRAKGVDTSLETVAQDLLQRDKQDTERAVAPLKQADDAVKIDSTAYSIEEVVELLASKVEGWKPGR